MADKQAVPVKVTNDVNTEAGCLNFIWQLLVLALLWGVCDRLDEIIRLLRTAL